MTNKIKRIVALSATAPTEIEKRQLIDKLKLKIVFDLPLDKSVREGYVSPYQITFVSFPLDDEIRYVEAGSKKNKWRTTEQKYYNWISNAIERAQFQGATSQQLKFMYLKRMRFIYNLKTKVSVAKQLLSRLDSSDRTLIFAGSIEVAEYLEPNTYHSKSSKEHLQDFRNEKINRLSCVQALNEGINVPNVDNAVIVQVNSKERHLIQKIGRAVRYRPNHTAKIYVIYARDTVDENWVRKATESLDLSNAKTIKL